MIKSKYLKLGIPPRNPENSAAEYFFQIEKFSATDFFPKNRKLILKVNFLPYTIVYVNSNNSQLNSSKADFLKIKYTIVPRRKLHIRINYRFLKKLLRNIPDSAVEFRILGIPLIKLELL